MRDWVAAGGHGVVLETCHRAELYGIGSMPSLGATRALTDLVAVDHLFRVAAGLESVIVGEDEVLHQVRDAIRRARSASPVDHRLQRLFDTAIATGRMARSRRTGRSGNLAEHAVAWLRQKSDLSRRLVVVAGAGRMGAALAHAAVNSGAQVVIVSRNGHRAARLAHVYAGRGLDLQAGAEISRHAAGVAVALGGPWSELAHAGGHDLPPIADISAPQAVPDIVRRRMNGNFLGIDDLYPRDAPPPGAYIKDAEALVALKTAEYMAWLARRR